MEVINLFTDDEPHGVFFLIDNKIFHQFTTEKEVWPYSIDESILDMTHSWRLFGDLPRQVARLIQKTVRQSLSLYITVGDCFVPLQEIRNIVYKGEMQNV
jgi:Nucleotidyltransferase/DNA polymerase involved in DNA repair